MTPRARRALFTTILFFVVCAMVGTLLQRKVGAQSSEDESQIRDNLKQFTNVYALVEQNYAEPISGDKIDTVIYDGAIPGMLRTLDPHSNFYDPKAYAKMREDQRGHYYGVGMVIQQQKDKIYVITPYEGTPSFRAGIRPGDVITAVDGKQVVTEGNNPDALTSSDAVAKALKGPKGTHVQVTMSREGQTKPLTFDLVRDEIPHPSVDLKYEIRPGVGYIHLTQFQETTAAEVIDAINSFGSMKGLIFDLRGNPGGLLSQAVEVCDHLLSKGQTIVSQRGRAYPDQNYTASHGNDGKSFPIVVLVNRNTASAAEIVSGALQDHDRAWVLGETTFGKGLVQTVYPLAENTGLALTTMHFYTPSGRLIQRDYTNKSFFDYYYHKDDNARNPLDVKMTDSGRTVYGGGGITPDEKYVAPKPDELQLELTRKGAFFNYTRHYFGSHDTKLPKGWSPDSSVLTDFHDYLLKEKYTFTEADFTKDTDWVRRYLKREMYITAFNLDESQRVFAETDPEVEQAVDAMPKARALLETAKKIVVQRMSSQPKPTDR